MATTTDSPIKHVVVLMMENQSFDRIFGYLPGVGTLAEHPQSLADYNHDGRVYQTYPFDPAANQVYSVSPCPAHQHSDVMQQLYYPSPAVQQPEGSWPTPPMTGFLNNYLFSADPSSNPNSPPKQLQGHPYDLMAGFTPEQLPALSMLARNYAVCTNWFSSVPGPTGPNRLFANCASSGGFAGMAYEVGQTASPDPGNDYMPAELASLPSVFDSLTAAHRHWTLYHEDPDFYPEGILSIVQNLKDPHPQQILPLGRDCCDPGFSTFAEDVRNNQLAAYSFLTPSLNNAQHDSADARAGDNLVAFVYNTLYSSPLWEQTLLLITYDEHGGHYDQVPPKQTYQNIRTGKLVTVQNPSSKSWNRHDWPALSNGPGYFFGPDFDFTLLGVRVPAIVVSAYTPKGVVDETVYEHSSIPATLEALWHLPALTVRDAEANNVLGNLSLTEPRSDAGLAPVTPIHGLSGPKYIYTQTS